LYFFNFAYNFMIFLCLVNRTNFVFVIKKLAKNLKEMLELPGTFFDRMMHNKIVSVWVSGRVCVWVWGGGGGGFFRGGRDRER